MNEIEHNLLICYKISISILILGLILIKLFCSPILFIQEIHTGMTGQWHTMYNL